MLPRQIEGQQPGLSFPKMMVMGAHQAPGPPRERGKGQGLRMCTTLWPSRPVCKEYILRK